MAKKKIRKQKPAVAQHNPRHGAALGVPQAVADAFMALYNAKKLPQAQQAAQQMVDRYPERAFAWKALGTAFLEAGDAQAALEPLQKSHELDATDVQTLTSLAAVYYRQGNEKKAISYQTKAVNLQPAYGPAQFRLAEMLESSGQTLIALEHAQKALALGYDDLRSRLLISDLQYQSKYFDVALKSYHQLEIQYPGNPTIFNNLGNLHKDIGEYEKAELYYQKALKKSPEFAIAYSNAFFAKHYNPATTQTEIINFAKEWEKRFAFPPMRSVEIKKVKGKPLRIGLISSGFRTHPVGQMIASALESSHSDTLFYAYSTNNVNDPITQKIRDACKQWKQIRHLSQEETAGQIRRDHIDILIDLSGHGDGSCLQAISMRPAPLCIKWVGGLVNTMGLESIDYLLSDSIETPDGVDDQYTEKLIRLPDDYICYVPPTYAPSITSLPAIKNRHITLGCLNNPAKISSELLGEWAMLMHQLTDSCLLLRGTQYESKDFCRRIWDKMSQYGIEKNRVLLEGPAKHQEFLETYQRIDIALDTWPYSGGLTTCESLLMGVPVVTLPGPTFAGRHSASHLINAGLPELVTNSWDEYRQRVVELANDLPNLAVIRAGLRTILKYSPVCDAPRFANHFNNALRAIWVRYCEDKAPEALTFNKEGEMWFADEDKLVELPVVLMEETVEDKERPFEWKLDEPIIIVDNAAVLPRHSEYPKWMASGHLAVISFDPASLLNKKIDELKAYGELHHYPHALLGDGQPATLYATLDAEKGSTLKPLPEEQQPEYVRDKLKVLAELSINTVSLDSIEGLPSIDMLVLDDLHDAMKVLENGKQTLQNTLLIQVKVPFQPALHHQPNLAELQHWASRNGFRFYTFKNHQYHNYLANNKLSIQSEGGELVSAEMILLPTLKRMQTLSDNQRMRLACLLSLIYGVRDISYLLLKEFDEKLAERYFNEFTTTSQTRTRGIEKSIRRDKEATQIFDSFEYASDVSREIAINNLKNALGSRTLVFVNTGDMANHGIVQKGQKKLFDILDTAGCPTEFLDAQENTAQRLVEMISSGKYVIYGANRYYDMSISISGYGNYNIFQTCESPVIGTVNDHPYANFMLERIAKAPSNGLFLVRESFGEELAFMRPDIKYRYLAQGETAATLYPGCDTPHKERDVDILIPMNLSYALEFDNLYADMIKTADKYGYHYRQLVEVVFDKYKDFSNSLLSTFQDAHEELLQQEWAIQLPWSQNDLKLLQLLGKLDDVIRANKRIEALRIVSQFDSSARVVVLAPIEMQAILYRQTGAENILNWHFIGTRSFEDLKQLYTQSRYVLNVLPTYHDWLHERVRWAAVAGCAVISNINERVSQLFTHGKDALFYDQHNVDALYSSEPETSERIGVAGRELLNTKLISGDEGITRMFNFCASYLKQFNEVSCGAMPKKDESTSITLPSAPHMSEKERSLFRRVLNSAGSYFEFGSGGSTVWAIQKGLVVKGVESDKIWVDTLRRNLGEKCQLEFVDIGPTGEWGYPTSNRFEKSFENYSHAILNNNESFDLVLVDGRFRVACTLATILHILKSSETPSNNRIFIHDFWDRSIYHVVLEFLEVIERVDTAGVFKVKSGISEKDVRIVYRRYIKDVR